ncbi:MAG: respiratory nitrate reductase subunit gamma [Magnetococcales bacterium]|nr:respiratory nitrate reductase subunit gamma [Magnetococcales bacterium]
MLSILAYLALLIFVVGFTWRIMVYFKTPAPLKIPTTPAPITTSGVVVRMFTEVAFFHSLFKGNKWTWLGGYVFHLALALVTLRHLRYFINPLPDFFAHLQIFGIIAGIVMVGALGFLLVRRYWVDRVRHISSPADYLMLLLLIGIGVTGLLMKFVYRPDIISIKTAMINWITFQGFTAPGDTLFLVHFGMVLILMVIFPFSKLMHMGGIFFSPTRNQRDNPREIKHVNPWSKY